PYREANAKAEEIRNILQVLQIPMPPGATARQLVDQYQKSVTTLARGATRFYIARDSLDTTRIRAVAVAFAGPGIWGLIKGFLAFDPDLTTIRRISFYQNEETPGLGGDIATGWFCDKFIGKKIRDESGRAGFKIRRSGATGPTEIDGISGATLTCGKVEKMLNVVIAQIDKEGKIVQ
ncbi:MAG: FMN-binding protein, partial [Chitinivibrionales bacterium]|nr:FMN-binding protein [Chitinivibrionales bacterium]